MTDPSRPKKIWISNYAINQWALDKEITGDTTYIRADIVDELVEALEHIENYGFSDRYIKGIARATLAKARGKNSEL